MDFDKQHNRGMLGELWLRGEAAPTLAWEGNGGFSQFLVAEVP